MKKFAAIKSDGYPAYTIQPSEDSEHFDGQIVANELTMREFDINMSDSLLLTTKYYDDGWRDIQENTTTLDGFVLHALPVPCTITINSAMYECDDSSVELEFPYPGTYTILVKALRYKDKTFTVEKE